MNAKAIIPLALGLGVGLLAVKFTVDWVNRAKGAKPAAQTVTIVQTVEDIDAFETITSDKLKIVESPVSNLTGGPDRIGDLDAVVGRVTAKSIPQGVPILASMLAPPGTAPGIQGRIPPGFRAVSVRIDEASAVAYQLKPGDWVDVIVVMDVDSGSGRGRETIAEVILQHMQVASVGQSQSSNNDGSQKGRGRAAKTVTLLVPDPDAPKLHLAASRGKITLALRGDDDLMSDEYAKAELSELFGFEVAPTPPPKPAAPQTAAMHIVPEPEPVEPEPHVIVVYHGSAQGRGANVEQITFENKDSRNIIGVSGRPSGTGALMRHKRNQSRRVRRKPTPPPAPAPTTSEGTDAADEAAAKAEENE